MEYREQLERIRAYERDKENGSGRRKNRPPEQKRPQKKNRKKGRNGKVGLLGALFLLIQAGASLFFAAAVWILGILPLKYLCSVAVILLVLWAAVKFSQKRAKTGGAGKAVSIALSAALAVSGFYVLKVNGALDQIATGEENGDYADAHAIDVTEQPFSIYISGIDVYGKITQKSRSDVNLIATVNPNTHQILLTTTPRDYYVTIPGVSGDEKDKLTHAGLYGIDTSMATLEHLYDEKVPFYIRVNFTSLEEIVDVMGGVDVESELAFKTGKESGEIVQVQKGMNHFNGKQALAFARERHNLPDGDNQRGKHQQALLTGMIDKVISPAILVQANSMINSVAGNAETNMSEKQIKSLIKLQLNDGKGWNIRSVSAKGDSSTRRYCYSYKGKSLYVTVPYKDSVKEIKGLMDKVVEGGKLEQNKKMNNQRGREKRSGK